ncbi:bacterio-opsin activator domain-containing protein [Halorarius halobius]|uniref:helix-turn-helix domain-containing protein n=1 Tax=Halorarius halobius TaxID=2962671 RepID=UPI0020CE008C|nr:helix-turn-helix domain-containing protein [Halorarius halobius]
MSVIARFSIPAEEFTLGEALEVREGVEIRLESMIPTGDDLVPYFWVSSADAPAVQSALEGSELTESVRVVDEVNGESLFRVDWSTEVNGVIDAIDAAEAVVLEGEGRGDHWAFRVRFPEHAALSQFYRSCVDAGITVDLNEVNSPLADGSTGGYGLSEEQQTALEVALERGYFDIPRGITLVELSEQLGVSDSAVSQRIRRGLGKLISATIVRGDGPD